MILGETLLWIALGINSNTIVKVDTGFIIFNCSGSDRRWEFRCGTAERLASTAVTCTLQVRVFTGLVCV